MTIDLPTALGTTDAARPQSRRPGGVLIVDDDAGIRQLVSLTCSMAGFEIHEAANGMEALHLLATIEPDVVVLDVMMPSVDGLQVLERIRTKSNVPVLMLSALASDDNVILGLERGADDYVTKPFEPDVLIARLRALVRRADAMSPHDVITFDGLLIDVVRREVVLGPNPIELTAKEFDLLAHLARAPGRVFSRDELLRDVWHSSPEWQSDATVTEHVRRLRTKLEDDPEQPRWVQTVRGVGYRFDRRKPRV